MRGSSGNRKIGLSWGDGVGQGAQEGEGGEGEPRAGPERATAGGRLTEEPSGEREDEQHAANCGGEGGDKRREVRERVHWVFGAGLLPAALPPDGSGEGRRGKSERAFPDRHRHALRLG